MHKPRAAYGLLRSSAAARQRIMRSDPIEALHAIGASMTPRALLHAHPM